MFQRFKERNKAPNVEKKLTYSQSSQRLLRRVRLITIILMFSGGFNIALLSLGSYWYFSGGSHNYVHIYRPANADQEELQIANFSGKLDLIQEFKSKRFDQLVAILTHEELVEDGFTTRDLALASLVAFHYYDLSRALGGYPSQRRLIIFGDEGYEQSESIVIFPGLSDKQYERILSFIRTERWPLTTQGLFLRLLNMKQDASLQEAFFLTPEFTVFESLFSQAKGHYSKKELLNLVLDGDWQILTDFAEEQRLSQDLSDLNRQNLLSAYLHRVSPTAAELILRSDPIFAQKRLDDDEVKLLLTLLNKHTKEARDYVLEMLTSPRSDGVWMAAAERLYNWEGQALPLPYDHMGVLQKFVPQDLLMEKLELSTNNLPTQPEIKPFVKVEVIEDAQAPKILNQRSHLVQSGDTLSGIAYEYGVSLESLREYNDLESDFIYQGKSLEIPDS